MSRRTPKPVAYAMITHDEAEARQRAKQLNALRRYESFSWAVRELPNGRFAVVALARR